MEASILGLKGEILYARQYRTGRRLCRNLCKFLELVPGQGQPEQHRVRILCVLGLGIKVDYIVRAVFFDLVWSSAKGIPHGYRAAMVFIGLLMEPRLSIIHVRGINGSRPTLCHHGTPSPETKYNPESGRHV